MKEMNHTDTHSKYISNFFILFFILPLSSISHHILKSLHTISFLFVCGSYRDEYDWRSLVETKKNCIKMKVFFFFFLFLHNGIGSFLMEFPQPSYKMFNSVSIPPNEHTHKKKENKNFLYFSFILSFLFFFCVFCFSSPCVSLRCCFYYENFFFITVLPRRRPQTWHKKSKGSWMERRQKHTVKRKIKKFIYFNAEVLMEIAAILYASHFFRLLLSFHFLRARLNFLLKEMREIEDKMNMQNNCN